MDNTLTKLPPNVRRPSGMPTARAGMSGLNDYVQPQHTAINPATSMPQPPGPAISPVALAPVATPTMMDVLQQILATEQALLKEVLRQSVPLTPIMRATNVDDTGATMDWSMFGTMTRVAFYNEGPDEVFISFDKDGERVDAFVSNNSQKVLAKMSDNFDKCKFQKIGVRCATGKTATVYATGFQDVAGNQGGSLT